MTPETFFAEFGHFADAPNGVQKLRELILQLAVQGKLVPQDPRDEPADEVLEKIADLRQRLLKAKKLRAYYAEVAGGTSSSMKNVFRKQILGLPVPIPPPAEQTRIVAKVDQLMALLDALEAKLNQAQEQSGKLMEAAVRQFAGQAPKPAPAAAPLTPGRVGTAHRLRPGTGTAMVGGAHPTPTPAATSSRAGLAPPKPPAMVGGAHPMSAEAPPAPSDPRRARANGSIPQAILDHMRPGTAYARADIVDALGISTGDWTWAIQQLKEGGRVVQTGQRRGARYRLSGDSDV